MITIFTILVHGFVALVVLPLAVLSLLGGSKPPEGGFLTKYYLAEPRLMLASNVFLLAVGATALSRLAEHFGLVGTETASRLDVWIGVPFMLLLVVFLGLFSRAFLKVRRAERQI